MTTRAYALPTAPASYVVETGARSYVLSVPGYLTETQSAAGVKWHIFMRHSMLPLMFAANPAMDRRQLMAFLGLAKDL